MQRYGRDLNHISSQRGKLIGLCAVCLQPGVIQENTELQRQGRDQSLRRERNE